MAQAEGIQARGQAGVFGGSVNPLQVYLQQGANRQRREQQLYEEERKKRDDLIGDLRKFNPEKVWEPFYDELNQYVQKNVRDYAYGALDKGVPVSQINAQLDRRQGEATTFANKINWLKSQHADIGGRIDKDQYLDPNYYHSKLNDMFFNGRNAKPVNEIDTNNAEAMFDDSKGYRFQNVINDFLKGLPQKINEHYTSYFDQLGKMYNIEETGTKLGLQYTPDGKVIIDPRTQQPKISMTDDVYTQALGNKYLTNILKDNLPPNASDAEKKDYLTQIMAGADPTMIKNRPMVGHKIDQADKRYYHFGGAGYKTQLADLNQRDELLDRAVSGKGEDILSYFGEATKDVKAHYETRGGKKSIIISYPSYIEGVKKLSEEELAALPDAKKVEYYQALNKSKSIQQSTYPINTEDERRAAKVALSQRMDQIHTKSSIGEEYPTYLNEKRKKGQKFAADQL